MLWMIDGSLCNIGVIFLSCSSTTSGRGPNRLASAVGARMILVMTNRPPIRHQRPSDRMIEHLDHALFNIFCEQQSSRPYPPESPPESAAEQRSESHLADGERRLSAGLMRVNHAGEMAAQALYQGQSLTARDPALRDRFRQASLEEADHLNWCRRRLHELDAKPSLLDPLWYAGSLAIGIAAGIAGDRWNLGFLAETEHQVVRHLDSHLTRLPANDERSRSIVTQMKTDEGQHADLAESLGAAELPPLIRSVMRLTSKVMTTVAEKL
jgi:3-demethoxyubiquinol 3-hydroxylase